MNITFRIVSSIAAGGLAIGAMGSASATPIHTINQTSIPLNYHDSYDGWFDWLWDILWQWLGKPEAPQNKEINLQLLSFNDFHGHLDSTDKPVKPLNMDAGTAIGGSEFLAAKLDALRGDAEKDRTLTVAAGDLIGGSTFLSGLFHDEPTVEAMNALKLDVSSVGNHEFDEGTAELLRMQNGGCHPKDGCYFPDQPYEGADFPWLAANVKKKYDGQPLLPGTTVRRVDGVNVGFIGMTLEETPTLVNPAGVSSVRFEDEVATANAEAKKLQAQGIETIIVLLHEGGYQTGGVSECAEASGPIVEIARTMDPAIDALVTGHTHQPYVCSINDPAGKPRLVTSAASYGQVVTESTLVINQHTGDVVREKSKAVNHLVLHDGLHKSTDQTKIIDKWKAIAEPVAAKVVGTIAEDVTGDSGGDRGVETPMGDLIADSILWGTSGNAGGAQIAFMNIGGVRASFEKSTITNGEKPGEITYAEAYATSPFGNLLVSMDLTGQQIKDLLEQQYDPSRSRQTLALGVSRGFTYTWNADAQAGQKVDASSMRLNGEQIDLNKTYRVATLNFLAAGGDSFTKFTEGTNVLGGSEDLANLVAYLQAHPGITPPEDRVTGL